MARIKIDSYQQNALRYLLFEAKQIIEAIENYKPYKENPVELADRLKIRGKRIMTNIESIPVFEGMKNSVNAAKALAKAERQAEIDAADEAAIIAEGGQGIRFAKRAGRKGGK